MKKQFILMLTLLLTFFLDHQLANFFSNLTGYQLIFSSYLMIICLFYAGISTRQFWYYPFLVSLGIFYDAHYFGVLGLSVWLLPICLYLFRLFRHQMLAGRLERFLFLMCLLFTFSLLLYFLAYLYGMTTYPITYFITYNLAPSLLLNALYLLLLQKWLDKTFL